MHGSLRFVLALMVALSHLGVSLPNFNQGVFAVVVFYILAGMVSYKLISNYYVNSPFLYYKDRIRRIFPLYLASLFLAFLIYLIGIDSYFVSKSPTITAYFENITIIPLAYYMYSEIDKFTLIPPAWSLGVELQFYILVPLLFYSKRFFYLIYYSSLFIFILAIVGILNSDYFAYRLLVGVVFIFLLGFQLIKAKQNNKDAKRVLFITYILLLIVALYIFMKPYKAPYNYEVMTALLIALPFLHLYKSFLPKNIEKFLGIHSYGIFLLHFPSLWIYQLFNPHSINIFLVILLSFILSILINHILLNLKQYKIIIFNYKNCD